MVVSLVEVIFSNVVFAMVVFVIAHCHKMHNISQHGATTAEALISLSAVVQEGSPKHKRCYLFSRGTMVEWGGYKTSKGGGDTTQLPQPKKIRDNPVL